MNVVTQGRDEASQRETTNRYEKNVLWGKRQITNIKLKVVERQVLINICSSTSYRQEWLQSGTIKNLSHAFYISKNPWRILKKLDLVNTIEDGIDSI